MNITLIPEKTETKIVIVSPKKLVIEIDNIDDAGHLASVIGKTESSRFDGLFRRLVGFVGNDAYDNQYQKKWEGSLRPTYTE